MTIPPRFLDEIRSRVASSDVIGKKMRLTRAGREFKGCCPFHKEKSPSFTVNDDKQFFHCFGCSAHGDVIGFLMRHDNLSFVEAVEILAAQAGLQMPKPSKQDIQKAEKSRDLHTLMEKAARWFEEQLHAPANREILKYVTERGLKNETIAGFKLGYAPGDRQALRTYLKAEGFTDEQMIEIGLVKKSEKSREPYVFFRDRVMFPVAERRGRVIAFGGRILPDHLKPPESGDYKPAKYINSTETPLFDKSRNLYGQNFARAAAREGAQILVTEGYMDVIACHQAGFGGAVAPMGTALTEEQIVLLWNMVVTEEKIPVLCFDGDNAGRGAAVRACEKILPLLKPYHTARIAFLPDGEDPDSLIKAGGAGAFQSILDSAISLFDFLWLSHTAGRSFDTPESRAGLNMALENAIKTIADREVQKHYMSALKNRVYETFFHNAKKDYGRNHNREEKGAQKGYQAGRDVSRGTARNSAALPQGIKPRRPGLNDIYDRVMLATILNHPQVFEIAEEALGQREFRNPHWNRMRERMIGVLSSETALDREGLQNHLKSQGFEKEMDDILSESVYVHAAFSRKAADPVEVSGQFLQWLKETDMRDWKEIQAGWKSASNVEDEERLKAMMEMKAGERG